MKNNNIIRNDADRRQMTMRLSFMINDQTLFAVCIKGVKKDVSYYAFIFYCSAIYFSIDF